MARGKEAVAAARRQVEELHKIVDRLTTENADLKVRTKRVEADASRVPGLDSTIAELREQIAAGAHPRISQLEVDLARAKNETAAAIAYVVEVQRLWERIAVRYTRTFPGDSFPEQLANLVADVENRDVALVVTNERTLDRLGGQGARRVAVARRMLRDRPSKDKDIVFVCEHPERPTGTDGGESR